MKFILSLLLLSSSFVSAMHSMSSDSVVILNDSTMIPTSSGANNPDEPKKLIRTTSAILQYNLNNRREKSRTSLDTFLRDLPKDEDQFVKPFDEKVIADEKERKRKEVERLALQSSQGRPRTNSATN